MVTIFGSFAVAIMMLSYRLEVHSKWFVLIFAFASAATAAYSGLIHAYPITVIETIWALIALQRFFRRYRQEAVVGQ